MKTSAIVGKSICGGGAACFAWFFGAFDLSFQTLLFFLVTDFATGTAYALQSHSLQSRKAWEGLTKKILTLAAVAIAFQIDKLLGMDGTLRLIAIYGFIGSELYSIIENMGKMGLKIPPKVLSYFSAFIEDTEKKEGNPSGK